MTQCHVCDGFDPDDMRGYVKTLPRHEEPADGDHGVYALDCEMSYTTVGLELTRVTVIDRDLATVYESLVKPENPIIDYNTRYIFFPAPSVTSAFMGDYASFTREEADLTNLRAVIYWLCREIFGDIVSKKLFN